MNKNKELISAMSVLLTIVVMGLDKLTSNMDRCSKNEVNDVFIANLNNALVYDAPRARMFDADLGREVK